MIISLMASIEMRRTVGGSAARLTTILVICREGLTLIWFQIETTCRKEVLDAAKCFDSLQDGAQTIPCVLMLDNFSPAESTAIINELEHEGLKDSILLEGSGNITESNLLEHAATGVDVVSMGALTHSPRALDIHQLNKGCDE